MALLAAHLNGVLCTKERGDGSVGSPDGSVLPEMTVQIVDAEETCEGPLELFEDAPEPISSSEPSP